MNSNIIYVLLQLNTAYSFTFECTKIVKYYKKSNTFMDCKVNYKYTFEDLINRELISIQTQKLYSCFLYYSVLELSTSLESLSAIRLLLIKDDKNTMSYTKFRNNNFDRKHYLERYDKKLERLFKLVPEEFI